MNEILKRVAFISQGQGMGIIAPPKVVGSVSIWTYEIVQHLSQHESVIVIEPGDQWFRTWRLQYEGAMYIYLPGAVNRIINATHKRLTGLIRRFWSEERRMLQPEYASIFHNLGFIMQAAWHAKKLRCNVIHVHNFSQYIPIIRALNPSARIVIHMHCEWLSQLDSRMIEKRLEHADAVIGCSAYIIRKVSERFPQFNKKFQVVYNGTDVEHFVPYGDLVTMNPPNKLRILFVGRISPEKGLHVLIEAFKAIAEKFPGTSLELVGGTGNLPANFLVLLSQDPLVKGLKPFYNGDYMVYLKSMIPENLAGRIIFHGNVSHRELTAHYSQANVFVNSSLSDAFPVPVVEAMAAGLPIVAGTVGGIPEAVVDNVTGLLVKPNRPDELASAFSRLLGDSILRMRMADAARKRALKLFSWSAIADQVSRVHDTTVEDEDEEILRNVARQG